MASELTITQSGSLTLNNVSFGSTNTRKVDVSRAFRSIVPVPFNTWHERTLISFTGAGYEDFNFCVITNLDSTNFVQLQILDSGGTTEGATFLTIRAGQSFVLNSNRTYNDRTSPASYQDIKAIRLKADTADVQVKIFIAH